MSKINKYANLYDKDGNLIRKVDPETGILPNYTTEELEELLDDLVNDKDENGNIKNPQAVNNVNLILMQYYQKYGNPHLKELLERAVTHKTDEKDVEKALNEVKEELPTDIVSHVESNLDEEYVDFEEIKDENEQSA